MDCCPPTRPSRRCIDRLAGDKTNPLNELLRTGKGRERDRTREKDRVIEWEADAAFSHQQRKN